MKLEDECTYTGTLESNELWLAAQPILNSPPVVMRALACLDRAAGAGALLDVGARLGGSGLCRVADTLAPGVEGKLLVTVDPYGAMPYLRRDGPGTVGLYGADIERPGMVALAIAASHYGFPWQHWRLPSIDFLRLIAPLGYWEKGEHIAYEFSTVFLDGAHDARVVTEEIRLVSERLSPRGSIVIDNVDYPQEDGSVLAAAVAGIANNIDLPCWTFEAGENNVNPICILTRLDALNVLRGNGVANRSCQPPKRAHGDGVNS